MSLFGNLISGMSGRTTFAPITDHRDFLILEDVSHRRGELKKIKNKKLRMSGRSDGETSSAELFAFFLQSVIPFCVFPTMSGELEH